MVGETTSNSTRTSTTGRSKLWSGILVVYLLLFLSTGYIAFIARDHSPALNQGADRLVAGLSNERTKTVVMSALQQEDAEYDRRTSLANQAFNVVLGALLGFLSATAVSKMSNGNVGEKG